MPSGGREWGELVVEGGHLPAAVKICQLVNKASWFVNHPPPPKMRTTIWEVGRRYHLAKIVSGNTHKHRNTHKHISVCTHTQKCNSLKLIKLANTPYCSTFSSTILTWKGGGRLPPESQWGAEHLDSLESPTADSFPDFKQTTCYEFRAEFINLQSRCEHPHLPQIMKLI